MSKPVTVSIPHQLGVAEARKRIDEGIEKLVGQIGQRGLAQVDKTWSGDRLSFSVQAMGQTISGHLDVLHEAVNMELQLPGFLAVIANKIKGRVKQEGQLLLK
jgi:hypothetical protein